MMSPTASQPSSKEPLSYDTPFQEKIARTLYQEPDFAVTISPYLDADLFATKVLRWGVRTILAYADKYSSGITRDAFKNALSIAISAKKFKGDEIDSARALIKKCRTSVPDRSYVKDEVLTFVKAMKLRDCVLEAAEKFEKHDVEGADAALMHYLQLRDFPGGLGHFYVRDLKKRLSRRANFVANGIPTGTDIDTFLDSGGLPTKQLGVVVAPPGRGKSLALIHFSRSAVLSGSSVLYVTLELSEEVIQDRFDAAFSNVYIGALRQKLQDTRFAVRQLGRSQGDPLVIKWFAPQSMTVQGLRSYLRQLERNNFYPDMIAVDFADYMLPSRTYEDAYTELGLIYQELRTLAKDKNVAIWTASQGNRGSVNAKVVDLSAMADSFKKAGIADVVIGLSQTDQEKIRRQARLYLAKNRNGSSDIEIPVKMRPAKSQILSA